MSESFASVWEKVEALIAARVSRDTLERWFSSITVADIDDEKIVLEAPNQIYQFWIEINYLPALNEAVAAVVGGRRRLMFQFRETEPAAGVGVSGSSAANSSGGLKQPVAVKKEAGKRRKQRLSSEEMALSIGLNERYQFGSFVVGANNEFARAACLAVTENPGRTYNPLFIYGGAGLGKTHLIHSIGHAILKEKPQAKVVYITSEQFTNEFIEAIGEASLVKFRQRYRAADVLLIDDVQFLAGKERSQEEFFHTFNALCDLNGKQVVMSSDLPASKIKNLEKRLVSRFEWGMTAELAPPDKETRMAILRRKTEEWRVKLDCSVLEFIADRVRNNVRRLEGALIRLASYRWMNEGELDLRSVEKLLGDFLSDEGSRQVTIPQIQKQVAEFYDVRQADLLGRRRPAQIALARQVAMFFCRELTRASFQGIGDAFGGRDHGTVMHACRNVASKCQELEKVRREVDRLYGELTELPER